MGMRGCSRRHVHTGSVRAVECDPLAHRSAHCFAHRLTGISTPISAPPSTASRSLAVGRRRCTRRVPPCCLVCGEWQPSSSSWISSSPFASSSARAPGFWSIATAMAPSPPLRWRCKPTKTSRCGCRRCLPPSPPNQSWAPCSDSSCSCCRGHSTWRSSALAGTASTLKPLLLTCAAPGARAVASSARPGRPCPLLVHSPPHRSPTLPPQALHM